MNGSIAVLMRSHAAIAFAFIQSNRSVPESQAAPTICLTLFHIVAPNSRSGLIQSQNSFARSVTHCQTVPATFLIASQAGTARSFQSEENIPATTAAPFFSNHQSVLASHFWKSMNAWMSVRSAPQGSAAALATTPD